MYNQSDLCAVMTRDNMAPRCDSSPFPSSKCQKRKRRWDVTPEDLEREKEELLSKQKWREDTAGETVRQHAKSYIFMAHLITYRFVRCFMPCSFCLNCCSDWSIYLFSLHPVLVSIILWYKHYVPFLFWITLPLMQLSLCAEMSLFVWNCHTLSN